MYRSVFRDGLFAGKTVIVTGGGSGIGRCTAHELAALGADVALIGRNPEKLETVRAEIAEDGGSAACFPLDIREEGPVEETVGRVLERFGRIDGLVNNAGGQFPAPLAAISLKGWEAVVKTNLTGGFLMAKACFLRWMAENGGSIVNIVADMWHGMPGMGHSGAARAGMVNFTETAALEWAPCHVRVNAVAPGWIASSGMDKYPPHMKDTIRTLAASVPLGRLGLEAEVSAAIVFLLSPAASFVSGSTLRVDGAAPNVKPNWPMPKAKPAPAFDGFHRAVTPRVLAED
ncbi:SDR family oxidoreductase [Rhodospirillum centenum]|uniref:Peroxisomal trans-2-enoyl-CoA reductase n=1 Tax=Rhodospirillum centenum (strain ATCC 51521 / SW) TaxID=414684 RepID=B6IX63_RHOCS|nr:SDR family oxidoreductase [Rhodospirillum centenum]ACJ00887.1 peroxisomal trans-2-enoyl-CoA reductase [Rhodospirillum centenum SW]